MTRSWLTLIGTLLAFSVVQQSHSEVLDCHVPEELSVEMSQGIFAVFSDSRLQVSLDFDKIEFHKFPSSSHIHIKAQDISIGFKGQMTNEIYINSINTVQSGAEKFSQSLLDNVSGIAKSFPLNETTHVVYDCRLILLPDIKGLNVATGTISNTIRRVAESCIESVVCNKFSRLQRWKLIENFGPECLFPSSTFINGDGNEISPPATIESFQSIINKMVDIALAEVIAKLSKDGNGMIDIPDMHEDFSTGQGILKTNGRLDASNGTFGNLATLARTSNAVLTSKGYKYEASCAFGLTVAKLNYKGYKLKYGLIKVNGHIDAAIDGVGLATSISLDYTTDPCVVKVEKMKVTNFGKININLSGLGPLNSIAGSLFGWIGDKWKTDIINVIEKKLTSTVQEQLVNFECERFRP